MRRGSASLALALCLALAGCGGDSYVRLSSGGVPAAGVATSGSTVYVNTSGSVSPLGTLIAAVILATQSYISDLDYAAGRSAWPGVYPERGGIVPLLDAERRVIEQDCTRPIVDWSANLRCK